MADADTLVLMMKRVIKTDQDLAKLYESFGKHKVSDTKCDELDLAAKNAKEALTKGLDSVGIDLYALASAIVQPNIP